MTDENWVDNPPRLSRQIGDAGKIAARIFVWLILAMIIAGAVYATCLPSITYQHDHPAHGEHAGPNR